jgi:hypothetical protein
MYYRGSEANYNTTNKISPNILLGRLPEKAVKVVAGVSSILDVLIPAYPGHNPM